MIFQLESTEARSILEAGGYAHLGCVVDDEPYVVPINYIWADGYVYGHSTTGRKLDGLRQKPRLCLQIETIRSEYHWRSVQAFGSFEEITEYAERERVYELLFARFPRLTPADSVRRGGHVAGSTVVFRVRLDRVVGVGEGEI